MKAEHGNGNGHGKSLNIEALRLLPTPNTHNWKESGHCRDFGADMTHALTCGCDGGRNGDADQERAGEELRDVRDANGAEAVREAPRGLGCVPASSPLLPVVREHAQRGDEGRSPLAGQEASSEGVCGVCHDCGPACASQRSEPGEQRPGKPDDALRELPPTPALAGRPIAADGRTASRSVQNWGEYETAIRRWEMALGRPAPSPTIARESDGKAQLSAVFCEWLMGLPEGHVTDPAIGISRNDQLKALGNGVVPQQCAAALRAFLTDTAQERAS